MLKKRIIPKLLLKQMSFGALKKDVIITTKAFAGSSIVGDPISQAKVCESQQSDELIFLDIEATAAGRTVSVDLVRKLADNLFMPFCVGGGISNLEHARELLQNGADKVSINSGALANPQLIREISTAFGKSSLVVSIDYFYDSSGARRVFSRNSHSAAMLDPLDWAMQAQELGAGEILFTDTARDGTRRGLDVELLESATGKLSIPVIGSGGVGLSQHFIEAFQVAKVEAVAAGSFFSFKDENPIQTRAQIKNAGIPVR